MPLDMEAHVAKLAACATSNPMYREPLFARTLRMLGNECWPTFQPTDRDICMVPLPAEHWRTCGPTLK